MWEGIVTPLSGCSSVCPVHTSCPSVQNGVRPVSFKKIRVLDSYFIHGYIIMIIGRLN